jgi:proteasome assembly chaperone (PAC2) family protein
MSDIEDRGGHGNITGLNGLLLGVAKKRGIGGICLMGEIPIYLQGLPIAYPKASRSVMEVLAAALGIEIDLAKLNAFISQSDKEIEILYDRFPAEIKEHLEKLRQVTHAKPTEPGPITDEDKRKILDDIDKFFKKGPKED